MRSPPGRPAAAELTNQLEVIRRQAGDLTASRARLSRVQDAERQRIQRDLHDGVQQDLVVSIAKLAMARERLRSLLFCEVS
jgi:signal transduction histidine kinase